MSEFVLTETSDSFSLVDNVGGFSVFPGAKGEKGDPGEGVPTGGTTGQVLTKRTDADYDTEWTDPSADITVDSALSDTSENPVQNKVITAALNEKAAIITDTASGSIASFPDGADGLPMKQIIANITPVQDLNGYDAPWPPGGGVNKFDKSQMSDVSSSIKQINLQLKSNTQYTASTTLPLYNGTTANFFFHLPGESESTNSNGVSNNKTRTLTTGNDGIAVAAYRLGPYTTQEYLAFDYQVEEGNTASAQFSPYSNICPISGHTGMTVSHSGADMSNPETIPISWQSEAGTVYGGNLTINEDGSCVLTVDRAMVDMGTLGWFYNSTSQFFSATIADMDSKYTYASDVTDIIMSIAKYKGAGVGWANMKNGDFGVNAKDIRLKLTDYTTTASLVAAITGQQLVYPLATPQTYTLPSVTMLETLLGTNNIWTNTGDTAVEYSADTKQFILKKIAELST